MPQRIFFTVGEVSGDNHAAGMIAALKRMRPDLQIDAVGGPAMEAAGATVHFETTKKAAMTLHGVKRVAEIRRLEKWLIERYRTDQRPDLHVCVDSSGFNLRFAKMAKSMGVPTLYYVAPQLWASREGRIKQMRACVDRLACIFPFEAKWFSDRGVNTTFVGHPLFDHLPANRFDRTAAVRYPDRAPVIGVVAGSRASEIRANLPGLIGVMKLIGQQYPEVSYLLPITPAGIDIVGPMLMAAGITPGMAHGGMRNPPGFFFCDVEPDAFDKFIPRCDLVLCKSGTSTVHVAAYAVPMIVVYRVNTLLWHGAARFLIKTPKIAMVNILAGNIDLVPELIPWNGDPALVANEALRLLAEPERMAELRIRLREVIRSIDVPGASENVAQIALEMLGDAAVAKASS